MPLVVRRLKTGSCAILRLLRVIDAGLSRQMSPLTGRLQTFYALTLQTAPGDGIFQALVERLGGSRNDSPPSTVDLHGDVLRLNS